MYKVLINVEACDDHCYWLSMYMYMFPTKL